MRISDWSSDVCSSDLPQKASPYVYARERPNGAVRLVHVLGLARDRADVTLGLLDAEHEVLAPLHHVLAQVLSEGRPSLRGLAPSDLLEGRLDGLLDPRLHALLVVRRLRAEEHTSKLQSLM